MSEPSKPMPLFSTNKERPLLGTSNLVPVVGMCIALLTIFWNFSTAQSKHESRTDATQRDLARIDEATRKDINKVEEAQKQIKVDVKEELKSMNQKVDSLQQILIQIQLQLVELKQQKGKR